MPAFETHKPQLSELRTTKSPQRKRYWTQSVCTILVSHFNVKEHSLCIGASGDKILCAKNSEVVTQLHDPMSQGLAEVKEQVSHFAENCKTLITVLDALSKAHPFIEGA